MEVPETYEVLNCEFSTVWADHNVHPWKLELSRLEEVFKTTLELQGDQLMWTPRLKSIYRRMQEILSMVRRRIAQLEI
jgi:hypothetical protein